MKRGGGVLAGAAGEEVGDLIMDGQKPLRHRQVESGWGDGSRVIRYRSWMTTPRDPIYAGYRYPAELISYAVWLYFRFPLGLRMVEEMLAARGISVTGG